MTTSIRLPPASPGRPLLTRMLSNALFVSPPTLPMPPQGASLDVHALLAMQRQAAHADPIDQPITWVAGQPHPLVPNMTVARMYVEEGGVDVYSHDGRNGMRHFIPMDTIRLIEEVMPLDTFADEIEDAEERAIDDDDDDEPEEEIDPDAGPTGPETTANGQIASS